MATTSFLSLKPLSSPPLTFPSTHHHHHHLIKFPKIPLSSFNYDNNTPECPVPPEQQPINEFHSLSNSFPFSWASSDVVEYSSRLLAVGACFAVFVGLPISWFGSIGPKSEPVKLIMGCVASGLFVVIVAVVRMYLGWAYVGNRLLSATVEYEETGWYDGQIWVKTAEVLARDRLLGSFSFPLLIRTAKNAVSFRQRSREDEPFPGFTTMSPPETSSPRHSVAAKLWTLRFIFLDKF
ncbi:uncharacterized protein ycf36-like isoform X2 [Salvia miltiorrhiza]|uniref:uncharacterized protein ycf36-like isoform X2 n=1 Tax=Salvia miltiorrhiza TaxID=226208 RepID=UPI0025ACD1B3|nr:uncharacterized protein ycf36-like isoform X2 [Salvia miltiorrhiza]